MERPGSGVSSSVSTNSFHFGARPLARDPLIAPRPNLFIPLTEQNVIPDYAALFTLASAPGPGYTLDSLTASSTAANYSSNVHSTVLNLLITPGSNSDLSLTLNVPFVPKAVTNVQGYVVSSGDALTVTCTPDNYTVVIAVSSPPASSQIAISFKLWSLNDLLPYDPKMAFQRVALNLTPILNVASIETANGLCHATKQGTVSVVIASISATISDASASSKFRLRIPSITRTLTVSDVAGSVQTAPSVPSATIFVESGDIYCSFTGNGTDTSYVLSVTINVFDQT